MMINVDVSSNNRVYLKKIIFGIPLHVLVKIVNIYQVLLMIQQLRLMKLQMLSLSRTAKKQKQFQQISMKNT